MGRKYNVATTLQMMSVKNQQTGDQANVLWLSQIPDYFNLGLATVLHLKGLSCFCSTRVSTYC